MAVTPNGYENPCLVAEPTCYHLKLRRGGSRRVGTCTRCETPVCGACSGWLDTRSRAKVCLPCMEKDHPTEAEQRRQAVRLGLKNSKKPRSKKDTNLAHWLPKYTERTRLGLYEEVLRIARERGKPEGVACSRNEYSRFGSYGLFTAIDIATRGRGPRCSWTAACKALGLVSPNDVRRVKAASAKHLVITIAFKLNPIDGVLPTQEEFNAESPVHSAWRVMHSICAAYEVPITWANVAKICNLGYVPPPQARGHTPEKMLADYRQACTQAGIPPGGSGLSMRQFGRMADYTPQACANRFGGWARFVEEAGYQPRPSKYNHSDPVMRARLSQAVREHHQRRREERAQEQAAA